MTREEEENSIILQIAKLEVYYKTLRKLLPYQNQKSLEKSEISGKIDELSNHFTFKFKFGSRINEPFRKEFNDLAHYLNQNVIIRLFCILQDNDIVKYGDKVNEKVKDANHVKILKKLRHILAHESGKYDPNNKKHRKAATLMIKELKIDFDIDNAEEFDLSIDTVIRPLFKGVRNYVKSAYNSGS